MTPDIITFATYEVMVGEMAVYPQERAVEYCMLGLISEVGELAALLKRQIRDGKRPTPDELASELGDCLWYLTALARECDWGLDEIASLNYNKLVDRQMRGVLKGSGDNR